MQWPYGWMTAAFVAAGAGMFLPWLTNKHRRLTALACVVVAVCTYYAYEFVLARRARPGDPLIRVELFLLYPLLITSLASCFTAIVLPRKQHRSTESGSWQYSITGLLIITTFVAIFFGMLAVLNKQAN